MIVCAEASLLGTSNEYAISGRARILYRLTMVSATFLGDGPTATQPSVPLGVNPVLNLGLLLGSEAVGRLGKLKRNTAERMN